MAQIWVDVDNAMNSKTFDNSVQVLRFVWQFVTFSSETQEKAQIRWRKMGTNPSTSPALSIMQMMNYGDSSYPNIVTVERQSFATGYNMTSIDFPVGTFTPGVYAFQVNFFQGGATDWSGWSGVHRVEVTPFEHHQTVVGSAGSATKTPHAQTEGPHSARVEVVSAAGITAVSAEQPYALVETNKYHKKSNGNVGAVPEWYHNGTVIGRVKRTN